MPTQIKDPRLWLQSMGVVLATVLVSLALNGALAAPTTLGEPQPSPPAVTQSQTPYKAS